MTKPVQFESRFASGHIDEHGRPVVEEFHIKAVDVIPHEHVDALRFQFRHPRINESCFVIVHVHIHTLDRVAVVQLVDGLARDGGVRGCIRRPDGDDFVIGNRPVGKPAGARITLEIKTRNLQVRLGVETRARDRTRSLYLEFLDIRL